MRTMLKVLLFFVLLFWRFVMLITAARILAVFPIPSISHQVTFRPITQELAKRGHEVVVVTPDPAFPIGETPENLTEIDVHDISYSIWQTYVSVASGKKGDLREQMEIGFDVVIKVFEKQVQVKEFNYLLNNKNNTFDLLLLEACVRPALSLSHIFKVPVILVSSLGGIFGNYEIFGSPTHPILYPLPFRQKIHNLNKSQMIFDIYNEYQMKLLYSNHEDKENKVLTRIFGMSFPGLNKLTKNVHMLFLNIHPIWDNNRPVPPGIIYTGGLHQKPQRELPNDLSSLLDSSSNGVIYFSLGTNTNPSLLPREKLDIFRRVFSTLPYDVLWKWAKNESYEMPSNVKVMKWFPQADLLRHPKIKVFITQGGMQSTDEAITAGVPLIGIPMLGDQWYNVEKYVHHGIGVQLDLETLTEEHLLSAINDVISKDSYRQNIARLRSLMLDQPMRPLERAVWWIEHVLRHKGAGHLQTPAANLTWMEYYQVELIAVLLCSIALAIGTCSVLVYVAARMILNLRFRKLKLN